MPSSFAVTLNCFVGASSLKFLKVKLVVETICDCNNLVLITKSILTSLLISDLSVFAKERSKYFESNVLVKVQSLFSL